MINLYTDATPNGLKISIALEELNLEYQTFNSLVNGGNASPEFVRINPNKKIPVIIDNEVTVTESGAILYYLAEKTGKLLPTDLLKRTKVVEMLMLQMSGLGPNFGQLMVWAGAWNNEHPVATERYMKEVTRLFGVLDRHLEGVDYFGGDEYSIADIAFFPWVRMAFVHPIGEMLPINDFNNVRKWYQLINEREAVQKGLLVPVANPPEEQMKIFVNAVVGLGKLHN